MFEAVSGLMWAINVMAIGTFWLQVSVLGGGGNHNPRHMLH